MDSMAASPVTPAQDQALIFLTILGMLAVTYLPRFLPALVLSTRRLPDGVARWLSYVPTAVLSALLAQSIAAPQGTVWLGLDNLFLPIGVSMVIFGWATKSFFAPVACGLVCVAVARALGLG